MSIVHFSCYDPKDGAIVLRGSVSQEFLALTLQKNGLPHVLGDHDPASWYIREGKPAKRQLMAIKREGTRLLDIPPGASIIVDGETHQIEGTMVELDFDVPGTYPVTLQCAPAYLDTTIEITV